MGEEEENSGKKMEDEGGEGEGGKEPSLLHPSVFFSFPPPLPPPLFTPATQARMASIHNRGQSPWDSQVTQGFNCVLQL